MWKSLRVTCSLITMTSCCCYWCWEFSAVPPCFQEQSTKQECVEVCRISLHQPHCINNPSVLARAHSHVWKGEEGCFVAARQSKEEAKQSFILFSYTSAELVCAVICASIPIYVLVCAWGEIHRRVQIFYYFRNSCFYFSCFGLCLLTMTQKLEVFLLIDSSFKNSSSSV